MSSSFFSICIPVYKNVVFLKRLLDSIFIQSYNDYEIIITDDSPDDAVEKWLRENYQQKSIQYFKNERSLGTPENWNEAIRKSNGKWIKLMHDDDWFAHEDSLKLFADYINKTNKSFYFSAYQNVYLETNKKEVVQLPYARWAKVQKNPCVLYARNIIGPPSVVVVTNAIKEVYDKRMKWLVDIDYYMRILSKTEAVYIPDVLINVGLGSEQVTAYTHQNPAVEIPEGLLLLQKLGNKAFDNILFFDAWWRLIRNLNIANLQQFHSFAGELQVSHTVKYIISTQAWIPKSLLKMGIVSKPCMSLSWLLRPGAN